MKVLDFYTEVLHSLGAYTDNDGFIFVDKEMKQPLVLSGKSVVLPTRKHIETLIVTDEDGKTMVTKSLFNPIDENIIKGDSISFKVIKRYAALKAAHSFVSASALLLKLSMNSKLKAPMYITKFLAELKEAKTAGTGKVVDDKTIQAWERLYANSFKENIPLVKVYSKKMGVIDGVKHTRVVTASFPLYEELCKAEPNTKVLGVKLRSRDLKVFKILHSYLLGITEDTPKIIEWSDDNESPAFISIMNLYLKINSFNNKVIKALKDIDTEIFDTGYINITITEDDLDGLYAYKADVKAIPSITDTNRASTPPQQQVANTSSIASTGMSVLDKMKQPTQQHNVSEPTTSQLATETPKVDSNIDSNREAINKILYGGGSNLVPSIITPEVAPQMILPQSQLQMSTQQAIPGGVDSLVRNGVYNQPIVMPQRYQQPMGAQQQYQQPMGVQQQYQQPMGVQQQYQQPYQYQQVAPTWGR